MGTIESKTPGIRPNQERREGEPRIEITFFFSAHRSMEDFACLQKLIAQADIYIPEAYGWMQEELDYLREIAKGEKKPKNIEESRGPKDAKEQEDAVLYNSNKDIYFFDVPKEHELVNKSDGSDEENRAMNEFIYGDFDEAIALRKQAVSINSDYNRHRESYIRSKIEEELPVIIGKDPKYKSHPVVKVLVALGSYHTDIANKIESDYNVSKKFSSNSPYIYSYGDELNRRDKYHKPIDDLLVVRALLEDNIFHYFKENFADVISHDIFTRIIRIIIGSIKDIRQFRQISNECFQQGLIDNFAQGFETVALKRAILGMTGYKLPQSQEELDQLLVQCGIKK
ncbi:MAG: hypothetical protein WC752_03680 [Patescibacteria group bacterium]|jgi:tetratricopeptide (TPR) repeat protein